MTVATIAEVQAAPRADRTALDRKKARARRRLRMRALTIALGLLFAGAIAVAAWPKPVPVEEATVSRASLEVAIEESGKTRVRDRYTVYAPLAGDLSRIELRAGDAIERGAPLARIVPMSPALLDPRARAEAAARVSAAEAAERQARANVARAELAAEHAKTDLETTRKLVANGSMSADAGRNAELEARLRAEELAAARFAEQMAAHDIEIARAALLRFADQGKPPSARELFTIPSPIQGRVLRVLQSSAGVVTPGAPLLEVGDPQALEVVVDVLTSDAVRIPPSARVRLDQWGGDKPLDAHVRLVEPSAFTKLSALGVEEQRVNVVIDFDEPRESWARLGDGFRVEARILTWAKDGILVAPAAAIFRRGDAWAVFVDEGGRARLRAVEIGERNAAQAHVLSGLAQGDRVVVHPSSTVDDGTRIAVPRAGEIAKR
jgi:HlyD family secretion protein